MNIKKNISLKEHTTFKIGGLAQYFVVVEDVEEVREALAFAIEKNVPYTILAGGSNILVSDDGYQGLVIKIALKSFVRDGTNVIAGAGTTLLDLLLFAAQHELSGAENMTGIPGSVGGAVRGNAGAFGIEIKDFVTSVSVLYIPTGDLQDISCDDCDFGYRKSIFKKSHDYIVLAATFQFETGEKKLIEDKMYNIINERNKRHIQNIKSAGSFFINPEVSKDVQKAFEDDKGTASRNGRVPAGWLLERVALEQKKIGGVQAGTTHANYFINVADASASDVIQLASLAKARVRDHFGVQLKEEVTMLGF